MQDDKLSPGGSGRSFYSTMVGGVLKFFRRSDASEFFSIDGANKRVMFNDNVKQLRTRFSAAQINAGATVLAAIPGYKYRLIDAAMIAIGGNAATVTSVDLTATLSTSRVLFSALVAGLTRSTLLRAGAATNGVILADGASFTANDANTAVTIIKNGADLATATHIDLLLTYTVDPA
jgi:hypothetical protein